VRYIELVIGKDKDGQPLTINTGKSHAIFICGKRGAGKSYTMGVIAEELVQKAREIVPIIVDPIGVYWTMAKENDLEDVMDWDIIPQGFPVHLIVPGDPKKVYGEELLDEMEYLGIKLIPLKIPPYDLEPDEWLDLYGLSLTDAMGIALFRATAKLYSKKEDEGFRYNFDNIIEEILNDEYAHERTKVALMSRLDVSKKWGIFGEEAWRTFDLFQPGVLNVIDLSHLDPHRFGLRQFILSIICKKLFYERIRARKLEEFGKIVDTPRIWLLIDEAHQFIPTGMTTASKPVLIRWVKEGRQPGLSIVLATQQPSAIDKEVLSQCDIVISHKVTMKLDLDALNALSHEYMKLEFKEYMKKIKNPGEAIYLDDEAEKIKLVRIRKRMSRHGGREIERVY